MHLGVADQWKPQPKPFKLKLYASEIPVADWVLQYVIWAETLFGWLAGGVILAVVAGQLKRTRD
jgi:hypothetical protein